MLFPVECAGCRQPNVSVCEQCAATMAGPVLRRDLDPGFPVWAGTGYSGPSRRIILALKNDQRTDTARALSLVLRTAIVAAVTEGLFGAPVDAFGPGGVVLASVPSTRAAYRRRGYRPVDVVVSRTGLKLDHPLRWNRQPLDQIGLGSSAREENLAGSLRSRSPGDERVFLLVDDVVTTGVTLREARRALVDAGGTVIGAAVIAATPRYLPPTS